MYRLRNNSMRTVNKLPNIDNKKNEWTNIFYSRFLPKYSRFFFRCCYFGTIWLSALTNSVDFSSIDFELIDWLIFESRIFSFYCNFFFWNLKVFLRFVFVLCFCFWSFEKKTKEDHAFAVDSFQPSIIWNFYRNPTNSSNTFQDLLCIFHLILILCYSRIRILKWLCLN